MKRDEAYAVIRHTVPGESGPVVRLRLEAHAEILRFGAPTMGETGRQIRMAEALSDICEALARLTT